MNQFYKAPFVYITTLLVAGVIFAGLFDPWHWVFMYAVLMLSMVLSGYFGLMKMIDLRGMILLAVFPLLGAVAKHEISINDDQVKNGSFILSVEEMGSEDKVWKKGVGRIRFRIDSTELQPVEQRLLFYSREELHEGDLILVRSDLLPIQNRNNPGEFDAETYWASKQIGSMVFIGRDNYFIIEKGKPGLVTAFFKGLRAHFGGIIENHVPSNVAGIAKAILLGDKSKLSLETRNSFTKAGAMHVLAVSGLHVGIIMFLLMYVLQRFSRVLTKRNALIIVLVITWLYAGVTDFSPSVVRASLMFSILLGSQFMSKQHNSINALFFSAFILIIIDPLIIWDIGFQLSYLAMLGILLLYKKISTFIYLENKLIRRIWEGTSVGIAAQVFTTPLSLYYFHQFPNYFMISNLGVMVLAGVILGMGLVLFAFGSIQILAKAIGILLGFALFTLLYFIQFVESIPGSVATGFDTSFYLLLAIYACLMVIVLFKAFRARWYLWGTSLAVLVILIQLDRYQNMTRDELIVLNSNKLVLAVKHDDQILCLHEDNEKAEQQAKRLMGDYQKVRPGVVQFRSLNNGEYKFSDIEMNLKYDDKQVEIITSDRHTVVHRSYESQKISDAQNIYMPYLSVGSKELSLKEGAVLVR